jgi:glycosyltransferase involved in cell wall biosynthesis
VIHTHDLLVNLSFVGTQPTGLATYALNLVPHLHLSGLTALASTAVASQIDRTSVHVDDRLPPTMTPDHGSRGHLRRLLWTELQLPRIQQALGASLLFSPIPEAPLFSRCRFVVTVHDLIPLRFPSRSPLTAYARFYVPQVLQRAQHILCNSVATAEDITRFYGIPAARITPILLAHDPQHFQFRDLPTRNYFLYIGRSDPYKNLHRLLTAFAALPDRQDYELWLAGSVDRRYTPALVAHAAHLGVSHCLKVMPYVPYDELPVLLNQAVALVFPSLWEGFGLPVLEAMACGTPVITSNVASLPEVAGEAAILVDPYRVAELTAAMQTVTAAGVRSNLRAAGLARASQFSWAKTGAKTAELLQQYL